MAAPIARSAEPPRPSNVTALLEATLGEVRANELGALFVVPPLPTAGEAVARDELAMALAALLFEEVLRAVPEGHAYALEQARAGRPLVLDHGGVRTVATDCGALPGGIESVARLLRPLGYARAEVYPLPALRMTGYAFRSTSAPEALPQYFVSELHPERLPADAQAAVARVVGKSVDPLGRWGAQALQRLESDRSLTIVDAVKLLPILIGCFRRQHPAPSLGDYAFLVRHSEEMAWIATEGQTFNHATDRVPDLEAVCRVQQARGRALKEAIAVSASGRVRQTALRAQWVPRLFQDGDGWTSRMVPGSFWEFISRAPLADGTLDLAFDAGNATEIFSMTGASAA